MQTIQNTLIDQIKTPQRKNKGIAENCIHYYKPLIIVQSLTCEWGAVGRGPSVGEPGAAEH